MLRWIIPNQVILMQSETIDEILSETTELARLLDQLPITQAHLLWDLQKLGPVHEEINTLLAHRGLRRLMLHSKLGWLIPYGTDQHQVNARLIARIIGDVFRVKFYAAPTYEAALAYLKQIDEPCA
ncbi:MAG: hypothetical protein MUF87_11590 [Anaerolineae bacterium]|nr:hypothetical protein [Anaerolineae bacterium]